jgi:hypothetical protein
MTGKSKVRTAITDSSCKSPLHIPNLGQYNFNLLHTLMRKPDSSQFTVYRLISWRFSPRLERRAVAGYNMHGNSGEKVNILGGETTAHSEKNVHMNFYPILNGFFTQ